MNAGTSDKLLKRSSSVSILLLAIAAMLVVSRATGASAVVQIPAGSFRSALPAAPGEDRIAIAGFLLQQSPVTNREYSRFVHLHPEWRRDRIARLFADENYLSHWTSAAAPGQPLADRPVTQVSWFAAHAYCEARGGRLPTWHEWEFVAAADEHRRDARDDPQWRQRILAWYETPTAAVLPVAGLSAPNAYGVRDMHGVIWEWVLDFNGMMVSADNRAAGDPDTSRFCGSGALSMEQKENYAILMRLAMLSSLQARYTTANTGFRCAFDLPGKSP